MKVNNVNGTIIGTCRCGNWLAHWRKYSGKMLPMHCQHATCLKKPEIGAHVQKDSLSDKNWYVVPLCSEHSAQTGKSLDLMTAAILVSASVAETCGRG